MLQAIKTEMNITYTENGAVTNRSSDSAVLDMFSRIGAMRNESEKDIVDCFVKAYAEDPDLAMKVLFYARDVRGGLGERRVFRAIIRWIAQNEQRTFRKILALIPEYGRFDDMITALDTVCGDDVVSYISVKLSEDIRKLTAGENVSLLAKWLPSVNASASGTVKDAKLLAKRLGMDSAEYRRTLSALRERIRIIENDLRRKDYSFDYEKQPSGALFKYRKAFLRNDDDRYSDFMTRVRNSGAKLSTTSVMPYDIVGRVINAKCGFGRGAELSLEERDMLDIYWSSLEDFTDGENAIAVIDGSGSMYGYGTPKPISIALSLGIYFAERSKGAFRDHFITFSENPQLVKIKGRDIADRVMYESRYCEVANTDVEKVFELLLRAAIKNGVMQNEIPTCIYIISDMEFDHCVLSSEETVFRSAKRRFAEHGYELPKIVFWNVQSRNQNIPVTMEDNGVIMVSGCTPRIFRMVASGESDPYSFMMSVIGSRRYEKVTA